MKAYIYSIRNTENNRSYIGQTTQTVKKRCWSHFNSLRKNSHHSVKLQSDFNEYGENKFVIEELQVIDESDFGNIKKYENCWIQERNAIEDGYNMMLGGSGISTPTSRKNSSDSHKGAISKRRILGDSEAIHLYSIFYFYGKAIRQLSKITGISRDVLQSLYKKYENIKDIFNGFDDDIKFEILKSSVKKYGFDINNGKYFPENVYYLIHVYSNDCIFSVEEMVKIFKRSKRSIQLIIEGKVKPEVYERYTHGEMEECLRVKLYYLSKTITDNPVPSLERNLFEG